MFNSDPEVLEPMALEELKENKQFAKMVAKFEKDIEMLRRKHEKVSVYFNELKL
jgi:hypothetical protein